MLEGGGGGEGDGREGEDGHGQKKEEDVSGCHESGRGVVARQSSLEVQVGDKAEKSQDGENDAIKKELRLNKRIYNSEDDQYN